MFDVVMGGLLALGLVLLISIPIRRWALKAQRINALKKTGRVISWEQLITSDQDYYYIVIDTSDERLYSGYPVWFVRTDQAPDRETLEREFSDRGFAIVGLPFLFPSRRKLQRALPRASIVEIQRHDM